MVRSEGDRIEILEDGARETAKALALIQQAQAMRLEREKEEEISRRVKDLEGLVQRIKGAVWLVGVLWAVATVLVGILLAKGW